MRKLLIPIAVLLLTACSAGIPSEFTESGQDPVIFPDYTGVTVPSNIAPLNFHIGMESDDFITVISAAQEDLALRGQDVRIPEKAWHRMLGSGKVSVRIFLKDNGSWKACNSFDINAAEDIDPYISYRLIPPSVESYERLTISQRDLTSFKEKVIYANSMVQDGSDGQCINCHHYRNYRTDAMQFHARQYLGGTVMLFEGQLRKLNLKTDSTISAGVYPAWHPTHDYIAYSTNKTHQSIHMADHNRIEVLDEESDLILYDIRRNTVSTIENDSSQFECYPAWAPDGRTLYYVSAFYDGPFDRNRKDRVFLAADDIRYSLYAKPFNPETRAWGPTQTVYDAAADSMSATLPRVSPDGRWLMFSLGRQGVFHIWHKDADLCMMDLRDGSWRRLDEINSPDVESYHSWSSNGRWIIFSTRREDGAFTRLYIAHMDNDGKFSKPFALPQEDPGHNRSFMYSYNIPEFMVEPVKVPARRFAAFIRSSQAQSVGFESKITE